MRPWTERMICRTVSASRRAGIWDVLANTADTYISLLEFMRATHTGAQLILYKHVSGVAWMSKWDKLKEQLHVCQSTITKVTLDSAQRETLVNEGKELVTL